MSTRESAAEGKPQILDLVKQVETDVASFWLERQAHDLATQGLQTLKTQFHENLQEDAAFLLNRTDEAYKLAMAAHVICSIARDPDAQYLIRYKDRDDAFVSPKPQHPQLYTHGHWLSRADTSTYTGQEFWPKRSKKHAPAVVSRALVLMLQSLVPERFATADITPVRQHTDPQYYADTATVYYIKLSDRFTLKAALTTGKRIQGPPLSLKDKNVRVQFSLRVDDPDGALYDRYKQQSYEYHMRAVDREITRAALEEKIYEKDPNAKKNRHIIRIPVHKNITANDMLVAIQNRGEDTWKRLKQRGKIEYKDTTNTFRVEPSLRVKQDKKKQNYIELTVTESEPHLKERKTARKAQLTRAAARELQIKLEKSSSTRPLTLKKIRNRIKTIYDMPVRAPIKYEPKTRYPRSPLYIPRTFDRTDSDAELRRQFPIPMKVLLTLEDQRARGMYRFQSFIPERVTVNGHVFRIIYYIEPNRNRSAATIKCFRYTGTYVEVFKQ